MKGISLTSSAYPSHDSKKSSPANFSATWTLWFCICIYPVDISGFGVNYLFILTPLIYLLLGGGLLHLPSSVNRLAILFTVIYAIASIYQFEFYEDIMRRMISYILFMSLFCLAVIKMDMKKFNSFMYAAILVSCIISITSIYKLFSLGLAQSAFEAKDEVGSQRYGFFLIFSFWVVLGYFSGGGWFKKTVLLFTSIIIFIGVILTFSRASVVAFAASGVFFLVTRDSEFSVARLISPRTISAVVVAGFFLLFIGEHLSPSILIFIKERLFEFIASGRVLDHIADSETSEGTRFRIWTEILDYVVRNPLTGSGFIGSWAIIQGTGSAHSQYMDILLRTGFIGFVFFMAILWRIWSLLLNRNRFLLAGFGAVLVYGFFHETFKEPIGAVLLAFLLSYYVTEVRLSR